MVEVKTTHGMCRGEVHKFIFCSTQGLSKDKEHHCSIHGVFADLGNPPHIYATMTHIMR